MHLAHNLQLPPMPPGESLPSPNPAASPLTTPTQLCTANGNSCDSSKPKMGLVQMKFSVAAEERTTGLLRCFSALWALLLQILPSAASTRSSCHPVPGGIVGTEKEKASGKWRNGAGEWQRSLQPPEHSCPHLGEV